MQLSFAGLLEFVCGNAKMQLINCRSVDAWTTHFTPPDPTRRDSFVESGRAVRIGTPCTGSQKQATSLRKLKVCQIFHKVV